MSARRERQSLRRHGASASALAALLVAALPVCALLLTAPVAAAQVAAAQHAGKSTVPAGRWKPGSEPAGWRIVESPGHHYQVQAQVPEDAARLLGQHLDALLGLYQQLLPRPHELSEPMVVKVFAQSRDFLDYGETDQRLDAADDKDAFYDPASGDVVACDTGLLMGEQTMSPQLRLSSDRALSMAHPDAVRLRQLFDQVARAWTEDTASLVAREAWHQYVVAATPSDVPGPVWLEAGLADCFAAVLPQRSSLGRLSWKFGALNVERLRAVHRAIRDGSLGKLADLLTLRQPAFDHPSFRDVHDAQSWATVQYLLDSPEPRLRQIPRALLADWVRSKNAAEAVSSAFDGLDLDSLQRSVVGWIDDNPVDDPLADLAREFGTRLQPADLQTVPKWRVIYHWHQTHPPPQPAPDGAPATDGSR